MEAFLVTHSHLELPIGCQGDKEMAFRKQARRTCVSFRRTVSPAGMRLSLKNPGSTVQIKCTQWETQQNIFKRGTRF